MLPLTLFFIYRHDYSFGSGKKWLFSERFFLFLRKHVHIWTLPAILSCVKCQWKVCYNKLKQGNFQKADVGGESQDICQELPVTSGHTKSFFSMIFGRFLKIWR